MADRRHDKHAAPAGAMRIDKFLWFARLASSRSGAQTLAESGTLRVDGRRIERAHAPVRVGNIIAFVQGSSVRVCRIEALPQRRGPASEAATLFSEVANPG
ncbi:MAG: S4 domain-containing protein [Sphingomonas sp.]|jgi:ribosome-associated heat shock protein Hsp15